MKKIYNSIFNIVSAAFVLSAVALLPSCNDNPDAYVITDGTPSVSYVRVPDVVSSDSLITHAFMGKTVALVGENLTSVKELWFNDQKAILNSSLITSNALIVAVPNTIPGNVTNKIYLINKNSDTVKVSFGVDVPNPLLLSADCEYVADGGEFTINGNYFLPVDGSTTPEVIFTPNIKATQVVSYDINKITVKVPAGAGVGPVSVKSRYGTTRSGFYFRDNRGIILDWDNTNASGGWRSGVIGNSNPAGITGNYVRFKGNMTADPSATWNEDAFSFNLWGTSNGRPQGDLFSIEPASALMKFEVNVVSAWKSGSMQLIFTPWATSGTNGYLADGVTSRGLWTPWKATGSFQTNGWITVTIPIKNFKYSHTGAELKLADKGAYGGLTFFLWNGGTDAIGADCSPEICIDNIRVVPAE